MKALFRRLATPLAMLILAGGIEYGIRAEKSLHVDSYYRELGAGRGEMNAVQRAVFSLLFAAGDKLQKHKRQAHASLPLLESYPIVPTISSFSGQRLSA